MRAAVILMCVALAACGGDGAPEEQPLTKAEYERRAGEILRALPGADDPFTPATVDDQVVAAADGLAALTPPPEIRDEHLLLVDGLRGLASDLRAAADAMEAGGPAVQQALDRVAASPGGRQAEDALGKLAERGYDLPPVFGAG